MTDQTNHDRSQATGPVPSQDGTQSQSQSPHMTNPAAAPGATPPSSPPQALASGSGTPSPELATFEKLFLEVITLHRRHFDMTDERFMIALLGFLQSWVQLPGVRARAAADLALARQTAAQDLKREDKNLSDSEVIDAVVASIMAVRI